MQERGLIQEMKNNDVAYQCNDSHEENQLRDNQENKSNIQTFFELRNSHKRSHVLSIEEKN